MSTHLESSTIVVDQDRAPTKSGCCAKFQGLAVSCLHDEDKVKWEKNMRASLSLMATIMATMTFQLAINPPGGVFQANGGVLVSEAIKCRTLVINDTYIQCPEEAVLAVVYTHTYKKFLTANTISFIASLSVCLLLVSGIPLKHRFFIWFLSLGMCVTITSLAFTYLYAASMVTPNPVWTAANKMFERVLKIWFLLLLIVGGYLIARMIYSRWITKCCCSPASTHNDENRPSS